MQINKLVKTKKELLDYLNTRLGLSTEAYTTTEVKAIIIGYGIREGKIEQVEGFNTTKEVINYHVYYKNKLPIAY